MKETPAASTSSHAGGYAEQIATIKSALLSLERNRGLVIHRGPSGQDETSSTYEMITALCPLSRHVLSVLKDVCKKVERKSETGCYIFDLLDLLKVSKCQATGAANPRMYCHINRKVLSSALASLETSSEVIEMSPQHFLPLD
ncbi:transcription elongation factor spt5 [Plakobranchus ocellatus]|uniref:Transcription elongation factor spt5 n=1 Tax=Plakobranchus ocellatus TaxID=259542 RepID=A0AAV4DJF9_9GAST|nr:transcription elongation factor spt5 [Plakobranchus ocellatus]